MGDQMQDGMAEAMRLRQQGRLAEATVIIQRTLGGTFAPTQDGTGGADEPSETARHVLNDARRPEAPSRPDLVRRRTLRPAPRPTRGFRGMEGAPGALLGTMPLLAEDGPAPIFVPAGGRFIERSYTNQVGTRAYKLYIPSGYVGQAVPLIIMLHGCTQSPDDFATGTHMNALAEEHTFLVAYPTQAQDANVSKCWNWFQAADQQRGRGEPSLIAGITCEVIGEYQVDSGRVYVAGMSAGGRLLLS
jgi:hypothetical protein